MGKVSIGLRGWRFDEEAVFDAEGEFRPLAAMESDVRQRVRRLAALVGEPCHACWLIHGEASLEACNVGRVVYGEPLAEVLLCDDHEADFTYWYREGGGAAYRGEDELREAFYEWFRAGNRAPEEYGHEEHVDTDPEAVPEPVVRGASCDVYLPEVEAESAEGQGRESEEKASDENAPAKSAVEDPAENAFEEEPLADDLAREYPS